MGKKYKIKISVLTEFINSIYKCSTYGCEKTQLLGSSYCKEHNEYFGKLYGLIIPIDVFHEKLDDILKRISPSEVRDDETKKII